MNSPHRARLSLLAKRFGSRVTVGETLAIPDYFRALWGSHLQVSTATHESLGIATLEAMYARNCCLLPDLGAYPEVVGPVREALYDPKEESLADRIVGALDDPEGSVALADRLADRAGCYRPDVIALEVEKVLHSVCLGL